MHTHITVHVFSRSAPTHIHISKHESFGNTSARINQLPVKALQNGTTALMVNNKAKGAGGDGGHASAPRARCWTLDTLLDGGDAAGH